MTRSKARFSHREAKGKEKLKGGDGCQGEDTNLTNGVIKNISPQSSSISNNIHRYNLDHQLVVVKQKNYSYIESKNINGKSNQEFFEQ